MKPEAKIHLSTLEKELVINTEWIYTKQLIIDKVYRLFGVLHERYREIVAENRDQLPPSFQTPGGKITRGDNYKGLPYMILDYPALFRKEDFFAIRTLFWWGHFFSISLHLSGAYFRFRQEHMLQGIEYLKENEFYLCVSEHQWEHHFAPTNYVKVSQLTLNEIEKRLGMPYFKIAKKNELSLWESSPMFLENTFREIIQFMGISFPVDETTL